ncbi:MAG: hypothetical protein HEQ37_07805 [Acidovorax sp.]|jgi:hypothetical protein|uniref:hypothetical protein n=1 Tax=Acidovorax sp. TaxID=1872122 RepID=UPI002631E9D6|nr:hypothetical protein [Acidovorax sp.]MCO4093957.1 hypothetical protein [Acidovorax sp.]MDH4427822.1 hypothetical protein [Acidovorax sp.]MDH4446590.1 hypothetical protein [Acidovorax sp.]MDH4466281.1 hypothetical protein [Acidovorax sp.]
MEMFDSVMVFMLAGLAAATVMSYRSGNEKRDVGFLAALTTLWGAGTAAALLA